jgi:hypothetical protein
VEENLREKYRDAIQSLEDQVLEMRMAQMIFNALGGDEGPEFVFHLNNQGTN